MFPHYFFASVPKTVRRTQMEVSTISAEKDKLINEEIRLREIRLIGADNEALGIMSSDAALRLAYEKGLDLVLMAPTAVPPVCRIMDYGKYRFDREKKVKEARKKQQVVELKEVQLSYRIDTHDFETKLRQANKFLAAGNRVRLVMRFKGREMSHMTIGRELMDKFIAGCAELGVAEKKPFLEGRSLGAVISPLKLAGVQAPAQNNSEE